MVFDLDWRVWWVFDNYYWLVFYVYDREGMCWYVHIGEGVYVEIEDVIWLLFGVDFGLFWVVVLM